MLNMLTRQSILRTLLASFMLVAIVPVIFIAFHLYNVAWENSWCEMNEKHQLPAQNLASPMYIYIDDHHNTLALLANTLMKTAHQK